MASAEDFTASTITYSSIFDASENYSNDYYDYDYDYKDELCNRTSIIGSIVTPVYLIIVVILSLFGNILVIVILTKYENLSSLTNALILNLAISDLFFTAGLPFWAYYHMYGWTLGEPACKTVCFIFYLGFYSSGILLILMTAHRYVAVMNPLSNIVSTEGSCSVLASVVIWIVSVAVASPALIFSKVQNQNHCLFENSFWTLWGIYQQNILFLLSSLVFIFCYSQIMCRLLRPTAQRRRNKTLKLIFILIIVFFVGWAPYNIVIFLESLNFWPKPYVDSEAMVRNCERSKRLYEALYVTRLFAISQCCLNPVFYVFVGIKFNNHLKKMLKSWGRNNNSGSTRSRQSRVTITSQTSDFSF